MTQVMHIICDICGDEVPSTIIEPNMEAIDYIRVITSPPPGANDVFKKQDAHPECFNGKALDTIVRNANNGCEVTVEKGRYVNFTG